MESFRFLKHFTDYRDTETNSLLIEKFGPGAYGVFWIIQEIIAANFKTSKTTSAKYSETNWCQKCGTSPDFFWKVIKFLKTEKIIEFHLDDENELINIRSLILKKLTGRVYWDKIIQSGANIQDTPLSQPISEMSLFEQFTSEFHCEKKDTSKANSLWVALNYSDPLLEKFIFLLTKKYPDKTKRPSALEILQKTSDPEDQQKSQEPPLKAIQKEKPEGKDSQKIIDFLNLKTKNNFRNSSNFTLIADQVLAQTADLATVKKIICKQVKEGIKITPENIFGPDFERLLKKIN